jgi:hypothetical protein
MSPVGEKEEVVGEGKRGKGKRGNGKEGKGERALTGPDSSNANLDHIHHRT